MRNLPFEAKKQLYHFYAFSSANAFPKGIILCVTGRCNLNCRYCEAGRADAAGELSLERLHRLVDELRGRGVSHLTLTGGEPFLRKDLLNLVEFAASSGLTLDITTNGTMLKNLGDWECALLKRCALSLNVSVDSHVAARHDDLRGVPNQFDRVMEGIENVKSRGGPPMNIKTVITRLNFRDIPEIFEMAARLGLAGAYFQPLYPGQIRPHTELKETKRTLLLETAAEVTELERAVAEGIAAARRLKLNSNLPLAKLYLAPFFRAHLPESDPARCYLNEIAAGFRCIYVFAQSVIEYNGDVQPCYILPAKGNIADSTFREEWKKMDGVRRTMRRGRLLPECRNCFCQVIESVVFSAVRSPLANRKILREYIQFKGGS